MSDTTRAIDRAINAYKTHGDNGVAYLLVALATLASHAPDVLNFILDQADKTAEDWEHTDERSRENSCYICTEARS